jgi:uncharacterized protein
LLLMLAATLASAAQDLQPVPPLAARVTDLTGTLTAQEQTELEQKLAALEARKGSQLAVLLVSTTQPEAIEQYSLRVAESWKLGRAKPDDGALLILAKDDRELRIEVGYGLEGALTDATSNRIIEEIMVPLLRQGGYAAAINAGIDQMIRVIDGEPLPPPDQSWQRGQDLWNLLPFLFIGFLVISSILRGIFGRPVGAALSGGAMGFIVWLLSQLLPAAIGAGIVAFLVALAMGLGGRGWSTGSHRGGGWYGGSGGGFGGGLGGGFRGGGGGFGGGGASGRW